MMRYGDVPGKEWDGPHVWLEVDGYVVDATKGLVIKKEDAKDYYRDPDQETKYTLKEAEAEEEDGDFDWTDDTEKEI